MLHFKNLKVLLPTSPLIPALFAPNYYMRSWYEVASLKEMTKSVASGIYTYLKEYDSNLGYSILFD